ncbi:MAG TPA: glycosyltransferase family 4 protein [Cyclobacteriaceae bacterium]
MNILFITFQGDVAGSTHSIYYLVTGLEKKGHSIWVGCRKKSLLYHMLQNTGVTTIEMNFKNKFDFANARHIAGIVKAKDIDLVNVQSSKDRYTSAWAKWIYGMKAPILHTRRQKAKSPGNWLKRQFFIKTTKAIILISEGMKELFMASGYPENHLKVIYNGLPNDFTNSINYNLTNKLRKKYEIHEHHKVIGCVSRKKNQDQLIKALKFLPDEVMVIFVGINSIDYEALIEQENISQKLIFTGTIDRDEAISHYPLFDVSVLPSTMDGFGMVLVEAMAVGIPVIGTNFGGIKNVIRDEFNGLLYEDGNIKQLASYIIRLLEDDKLRQKLIDNGYQRVTQDLNITHTVDNYESFFMEIISGIKSDT